MGQRTDRNTAAREPLYPKAHPAAPDNGRREVGTAAYQRLRDLIVSGRLAPGAPLVETELSRRLGASRTPVRAAIQRLQQEGFACSSRVGLAVRTSVAPLTAGDMREVFLMAGALEGAAARQAAGLDASRRDGLASRLRTTLDDMKQAVAGRPPDIARAHQAHVQFHQLLVEAGAGPRLLAELAILQPQAERYQRVYATAMIFAFDEVLAEHAALAEAVAAGDGEAAERLTGAAWRAASERYGQVVAVIGERGNW